jgi:hypothetical protein
MNDVKDWALYYELFNFSSKTSKTIFKQNQLFQATNKNVSSATIALPQREDVFCIVLKWYKQAKLDD